MTRANLNFSFLKREGTEYNPDWKRKYWLTIYWNGDQNVRGVRDFFHILGLLRNKQPSKEKIIDYLLENYEGLKKKDIEILEYPRVYYDGEITVADYSYIYDFETQRAMIFYFDKQIFRGKMEEVKKFIRSAKEYY